MWITNGSIADLAHPLGEDARRRARLRGRHRHPGLQRPQGREEAVAAGVGHLGAALRRHARAGSGAAARHEGPRVGRCAA